jgi:hypothetical protein
MKPADEHADFMVKVGRVLETGMKLKAVMVKQELGRAKAKCPLCEGPEALHGVLIRGPGAGRHRSSGGAFRMWCDNCADLMME